MRLIDNATAEVEVLFKEPELNGDNSPLLDLAYSSVYYKVGSAPLVSGARLPATRPTGGGAINTLLIVPAPSGARTTIAFQVSSTDLSGNESLKTPAVNFEIERLAPASPTSFTVA